MSLSGPFIWKQSLLGSCVQVECSEEEVIFTKGARKTVISYTDIKGAFYLKQPGLIVRSIQLQVLSNSGQNITFFCSDLVFMMNGEVETAKKAIVAFLSQYYFARPDVEIVIGFPRSIKMAVLWIALTVGVLGYSFFMMWRDGMMATALDFLAFAGVALFLSLVMLWSFFRQTGSKRKSAKDLFEELSG